MTPEQVSEAYAAGMRVARGYLRRNPQVRHQGDDIISDALLGVTKGLRDHNPALGSLAGYCAYRASYQILDGFRERGPVPREAWARGMRVEDLPEERQRPISLEDLRGIGKHGDSLVVSLRDEHGEDAYAQVDARLILARLLRLLPPKLRDVLQAHDLEGETLRDIGARYGVTDTRICQIRRQALDELRRLAA